MAEVGSAEALDTTRFDAFVAYSSRSRKEAESLHSDLKIRGLNIWIDYEHALAGDPLQRVIAEAAKNSNTAIVLIGAEGLDAWQKQELLMLRSLFSKGRISKVISVFSGDVEEPPDELSLPGHRHFRLSKEADEQIVLDELESAITGRDPRMDRFRRILLFGVHLHSHFRAVAKHTHKMTGDIERFVTDQMDLTQLENSELHSRNWHDFESTLVEEYVPSYDPIERFIERSDPWESEVEKSFQFLLSRVGNSREKTPSLLEQSIKNSHSYCRLALQAVRAYGDTHRMLMASIPTAEIGRYERAANVRALCRELLIRAELVDSYANEMMTTLAEAITEEPSAVSIEDEVGGGQSKARYGFGPGAVSGYALAESRDTVPGRGQLRMRESYEGVVKHVDEDLAVVVYEVDSNLVEQTYLASQFIERKLPKLGDRLEVSVHVVQLPDEQDDIEGGKASDEQRRRPKNFVPLPRTF